MSAQSARVSISRVERDVLLRWSRSRVLAARLVMRSRIVLSLADGSSVRSVTAALAIAPGTVRLWRRRFSEEGLASLLHDAPGRGRKPVLALDVRNALGDGTGVSPHLTVREQGRLLGVSAATVSRWRRRSAGQPFVQHPGGARGGGIAPKRPSKETDATSTVLR